MFGVFGTFFSETPLAEKRVLVMIFLPVEPTARLLVKYLWKFWDEAPPADLPADFSSVLNSSVSSNDWSPSFFSSVFCLTSDVGSRSDEFWFELTLGSVARFGVLNKLKPFFSAALVFEEGPSSIRCEISLIFCLKS